MSEPELVVYENPEALAAGAAERIARAAAESIASRGRFALCLTGGETPRRVYEILNRWRAPATQGPATQWSAAFDWSKSYFFFGDERFVPQDDDRSNYKMARDSLLQNAQIAADHVFQMPTLLPSPQQAAEDYERTLRTFFGDVAWPAFDLVLLGMGEDGHIASLFPGAASLGVNDRWVTWSPPGTLPPHVDRVTLTFPALNAARQVMFMVSGQRKSRAFADVYQGIAGVDVRPAVGIRPAHGNLTWLVDRAAAELLTGSFCG